MGYWIVDEIRAADGKVSKIWQGPFAESQRGMVIRDANKSDKYFQKHDPNHIRSYVVKANGKYSNKLTNKEYIYPENLIKRTLKEKPVKVKAEKLKTPRVKNSLLTKWARKGRC